MISAEGGWNVNLVVIHRPRCRAHHRRGQRYQPAQRLYAIHATAVCACAQTCEHTKTGGDITRSVVITVQDGVFDNTDASRTRQAEPDP